MNSCEALLDTFWNCGWSCSALISRSSVNLRNCARRFPEMGEVYLHHFILLATKIIMILQNRVRCGGSKCMCFSSATWNGHV